MTRLLRPLALAALLLALPGSLVPAAASSDWFAGAAFSVGGVDFALGFSDFDRHHGDRSYYYATDRRLAHRGYECHTACYIRDHRYYHHPECPLLLHHFERHGFDPYTVWTVLPDGGVVDYRHSYSPGHHDGDSDSRFDDRRGHGRRRGGRHGAFGGSDSDSDSDWR
jgi:hypothetical protein